MIEFKLWQHQIDCITRAQKLDGFALLWDPGTGKTLTTIQLLRYCYAGVGSIIPTLIVAPVIVLENWLDEFLKFSKVNPKQILVLHGPIKQRIEKLKKARELYQDKLVVITNYEGVTVSQEFYAELYNWQPQIVIADESQRLKNNSSKRTKLMIKLGDRAKVKYILTGTPILNSPMDIWAQYRFMDGGRTFGTNFYIFRSVYFYDKNAGMPKAKYFPDWRIRDGSIADMNKKIYLKAMRVVKSECLDLPPFVRQVVKVELSPVQRKLYESMKKDFIAFLESGHTTVAQLAITKALRLQQIVTGFLKSDENVEVSLGENPREAALKELLEEITPAGKVLVWCVFRKNYETVRKVCEELKIPYVEAHGEVSNKGKYEAVEQFNSDPSIRVFIGHPASLGLGISLCSSNYSIYFSRNFSLEQSVQSEARNYRGGSEIHAKVTRIDIVAKDTIDELVLTALDKKEKISEEMLRDWKDRL